MHSSVFWKTSTQLLQSRSRRWNATAGFIEVDMKGDLPALFRHAFAT
jgi:hypothetical protein